MIALVLVVALVVFRIEGAVVRHVEGREEFAHAAGEIALALDVPQEAVEIAAGALFDEVAPQVDDPGRCGRRLEARQALAHHQRDGVLQWRIGAIGDLFVLAAAMIAVLQHRREVRGDARHAA